jgi:hypothetical protein
MTQGSGGPVRCTPPLGKSGGGCRRAISVTIRDRLF